MERRWEEGRQQTVQPGDLQVKGMPPAAMEAALAPTLTMLLPSVGFDSTLIKRLWRVIAVFLIVSIFFTN